MAQLWGGRFTKQTDEAVKAFNDSIGFDKRLYRQDIQGSMAHARMLGRQGILTAEDCAAIGAGLEGILSDIESGKLEITPEYEDIHSFVEANLIDRIGDAGKRLHTGRSRNDQVALDMRLYTREAADEIRGQVLSLLQVILDLMEEHKETFMPGFTHLQKAQPTTLAHHLGAYFEMFRRDYTRISDCRTRMNESPLGAGALAGTTYPLDRAMVARELGFDCATRNSMDSVSDRDYLLEFLARDIQQGADFIGEGAEEPDVSHRDTKLDMAHALAAHLLLSNLNTASVANDTLVTDTFILAAMALPVASRSENSLTKETIALGLIGTIVDSFRLGHLAVRAFLNRLGGSQTNGYRIEIIPYL